MVRENGGFWANGRSEDTVRRTFGPSMRASQYGRSRKTRDGPKVQGCQGVWIRVLITRLKITRFLIVEVIILWGLILPQKSTIE